MFLETLPGNVRQLLKRLGRLPTVEPSYLAGGSAVALHLGHRRSVDLDFFIAKDEFEMVPLLNDLRRVGHLTVQQQSHGTLNAALEGTKVSFFVYPYPLLEDLHALEEVQIAELLDLALMKLVSISQRGAKRDFIDLYQIGQTEYTLDDLLSRLPDKYQRSRIHHIISCAHWPISKTPSTTPCPRCSSRWNGPMSSVSSRPKYKD